MGAIFKTLTGLTIITGVFTGLNYLDTKSEFQDKEFKVNLSQIARETKPFRDSLTNAVTPILKPAYKELIEYQTQPSQETQPQEYQAPQPIYQNQITQPKKNNQPEIQKRWHHPNSRIPPRM
ncbi:hypothetical protein HOE04_01375 [archaeon]|jgi:hypothetical protein|nr:hypothetical protein [archaeon]